MNAEPLRPGDWDIRMSMPAGGIELPVDEDGAIEDFAPWAEATARNRLAPDADGALVREFAQMLLAATADSRSRAASIAFVFAPTPELGELARVEVRTIHPDDSWREITLDQLEDFFKGPGGDVPTAIMPPEATRGALPAGPAVRVKNQIVVEPIGGSGFAPDLRDDADAAVNAVDAGSIMQTLAYAIRPPDVESAVVLFMSWYALVYTDELYQLGDQLAASLQIEKRLR